MELFKGSNLSQSQPQTL